MQARYSSAGLSRNERDAATAIAGVLVLMLVLLCTAILSLHVLSGLPAIMIYGIAFAMIVFTVVCGIAFMNTEPSPRRHGPPELIFRSPPRRRRRKPKPATPLP